MHGGPISARPNKFVVMIFGRGRAAVPQFHVGEHGVAHVRNYAYLRVTLHGLRHVDELLRGGKRRIAVCRFWTASANLPPSFKFVEHIFQLYVRPSVCFGLEFTHGVGLFL